jgi:Na+/H+-dicarboxylate symporter
MSILPYITVSLIVGIGSLSYDQARVLATKAGLLLLLFWGIGFAIILAIPLAFPPWESASFFSTSLLEAERESNFLELFIPANPFGSMADNLIPAVVLFSVACGVALLGIKDKHNLIHPLSIVSAVLTRIAHFVVNLAPIGVFAISASAAGTTAVEEFGRLQAYFVTYIVAAILLVFWILPMLVMSFTTLKYKDVVGFSKDALVTAFTTGSLFIILPILAQNCKDLFEQYKLRHKDSASVIDAVIPVSYNFPHLGKLLALLFILFIARFYDYALSPAAYPVFVFSGLFTFFGAVNIALPFMLDIMRIPSDFFHLFVLTDIVNGRFGSLLGAMNLLTFTLVTTCAITGFLSINWKKLLKYSAITIVLTLGVFGTTRAFLGYSLKDTHTKDEVIAGMALLQDPLPAVVHKTIPPVPAVSAPEKSRLERIRERGVIRVGYRADRLPFAFFNEQGDLVGFDIDMAHRLAKELVVGLEFVPFEFETMAQQLNDDHFDIIMSAIPITTPRLEEMSFSDAYLDATFAFVVKDHRRDEFATLESIRRIDGLRIGVIGGHSYFVTKVKETLPQAKVVSLKSIRDFFENNDADVDALLFSAEGGAAWTLLYPKYQVIIPGPQVVAQPLGYPMAKGDHEMVNFMNRWIDLKKKDKTIENIYNHWILGQGAVEKQPRWSVIRNVLHWVD